MLWSNSRLTSGKSSAKIFHILFPNSTNANTSSYLLYYSFSIHMHFLKIFENYRHDAPLTLNISVCISKKWHFLNQSTIAKIKKLTLKQQYYLIYKFYPDFASCSTNVLFPGPGSGSESCIGFSCHISPFNLKKFFFIYLSWPWHFYKSTG